MMYIFIVILLFVLLFAFAWGLFAVIRSSKQKVCQCKIGNTANTAHKNTLDESALIARIGVHLIREVVIPQIERPKEASYFILSILRKHLIIAKKYPKEVVDLALQMAAETLNISFDEFANRDVFYYNLQRQDKDNFMQNVCDIIETSQYFDYGSKLTSFDIMTKKFKSIENGGDILKNVEIHSRFIAAFQQCIDLIEPIVPYDLLKV